MVSTGADEAAQRAERLPSLAWSCAEGDIPRHDGRLKQEGERLKVISGYTVTSIIPWGTEHFAKQTNKKNFFFSCFAHPRKIRGANRDVGGHFLALAFLQASGISDASRY